MSMNPRLLRPRASGFDPRSIAGLQGWYDFSDASTLGPTSSGTGAVSNNGPVRFVKDKSTAGLNLTQAGADSVVPTFSASSVNGLSALSFDGGDFIVGSSGLAMTSPFSLFIVCRANVTGNSRVCGVTSARSIGPFATSNTQWGFFSAGGVQTFGVSATATSVLAMTVTSGLAGVFYGNGNQSAAATLSAVTPSPFTLGGDGGGGGIFNGVACEVLSYSAALSASQVSTISRYLGRKWGVTIA